MSDLFLNLDAADTSSEDFGDCKCESHGSWQVSSNPERWSGDRMDPYYKKLATYLVRASEGDPKTAPIEYNPNSHKSTVMADPMRAVRELKKLGEPKPDRRPRAVNPIPGESRRKTDLWGGKRWHPKEVLSDGETEKQLGALITWMNS